MSIISLRDLLPTAGLSRSGNPENCSEYWYGQDGPDDYRRKGGHPLYGELDITYRYNELGYRSPDFGQDAAIKMISVGCSWVFGVGVPDEVIFHQRFAGRLSRELGKSVINWNLGIPGASNDSIVRLLHLALPALRPDVILVLFTHLGRREYVTAHNRWVKYSPTWTAPDPVVKELSAHFSALSSGYDDALNLFRNYKSADCLLSDHPWCFSFVRPAETELIADHLDHSRQARNHRWLDTARDHAHPGPLTHQNIFEGFWETFVESGSLAKLCDSKT